MGYGGSGQRSDTYPDALGVLRFADIIVDEPGYPIAPITPLTRSDEPAPYIPPYIPPDPRRFDLTPLDVPKTQFTPEDAAKAAQTARDTVNALAPIFGGAGLVVATGVNAASAIRAENAQPNIHVANADPVTLGLEYESKPLPGWLIPVGVGVALLFLRKVL